MRNLKMLMNQYKENMNKDVQINYIRKQKKKEIKKVKDFEGFSSCTMGNISQQFLRIIMRVVVWALLWSYVGSFVVRQVRCIEDSQYRNALIDMQNKRMQKVKSDIVEQIREQNDLKLKIIRQELRKELKEKESQLTLLRESIVKDLETKITANANGLQENTVKLQKDIDGVKEELKTELKEKESQLTLLRESLNSYLSQRLSIYSDSSISNTSTPSPILLNSSPSHHSTSYIPPQPRPSTQPLYLSLLSKGSSITHFIGSFFSNIKLPSWSSQQETAQPLQAIKQANSQPRIAQKLASKINTESKLPRQKQNQQPQPIDPPEHIQIIQDDYVAEIRRKRMMERSHYEQEGFSQSPTTPNPNINKNREIVIEEPAADYEWVKTFIRWFVVVGFFVLLAAYIVLYCRDRGSDYKPEPKFSLNRQCKGARCYKIRSKDQKILYQPKSEDLKILEELSNQLLFAPGIRQMCSQTSSLSCTFTFQITQSAHMNISIGITDGQDRGINGRDAIYYTGRTGMVYENGREVGFHFVDSLEGDRDRRFEKENERDHKFAYASLKNCGFKVKDIITTEVNIEKGSIKWSVNGVGFVEYYSDYIKYMDMVPFIAMVDLYDGAYFLGV